MISTESDSRVSSGSYSRTHLAILLLVFLSEVMVTSLSGGFLSPFKMLFVLPVFLGSLYFGLIGGITTAFVVSLYEIFLLVWRNGDLTPAPYAIIQVLVFLLMACIIGVSCDRFLRRIQEARLLALKADSRAQEAEWLADTTLMMQSIPELEQSLSVALIRLDELIPFTSAGIFLQVDDDINLHLVQAMGLPPEHLGTSVVPSPQQILSNGLPNSPVSWTSKDDSTYLPYAAIDSTAKAGMIVPLCTLDTLIGLIYLSTNRESGFTQREQETLSRFSEHILYPIQRARLQSMATTDLLTGLANRRSFWEHLRNETVRVRRYQHPLSLILLDIDHFKQINDTYGHLTGDTILTQLGRVVKSTIRESDFGARYGGEELAVICPEAADEEAFPFAERLRRVIAETTFFTMDGSSLNLTVSIGFATMPLHTSDPQQLIECTDNALYQAKNTGRNRVCSAQKVAQPDPVA